MLTKIIFLHIHTSCWHLLLLACLVPLLLGLLLYFVLRQRLQQRVRALEAERTRHHENWTKAETEVAGLKYKLEMSVKELEQTKVELRNSESDLMILRGRLEQAQKGSVQEGDAALTDDRRLAPVALEKARPDDLKIVEGIGPKVEQVLKEAGIANWAELAAQDTASLQGLLDQAGPAFRLMDPSTWPEQALLAAEGRWDALRALQDALKGGRRED
ncbi:MAG: hypothetical protein ACOYOO_09545 [Saprospiraceae bacterium]|jgi:predicted flap endonuclease-1-like 5' DNA nuclease